MSKDKPTEYPVCKGSTVLPDRNIVKNEVSHTGIVTHRCKLIKGNHTSCVCECGEVWIKNSNEL